VLLSLAQLRYAVLYVSHTYVNDGASAAIATWVNDGGVLVSTVSGGLRNQVNASNVAISTLLGFDTQTPTVYIGSRTGVDARVDYIKQDLAFAEVLDTTTTGSGINMTVVGAKAIFTVPTDARVLATFGSDGSAAAFSRSVGRGTAIFWGFHPGLAYFLPAIPKRPVARGSSDECFNHWVPTDFNTEARKFAALPTANVTGAAPVLSSEPRVDVGVLAAAGLGTVIPVTNWAGAPVIAINITLQFDCRFQKASLASGGTVRATKTASGMASFSFNLNVADAIILR
jgi:hypothetical protein